MINLLLRSKFDFLIFKIYIMQKQRTFGLILLALLLNISSVFSQDSTQVSGAFSQVGDSYYSSKAKLKATYFDEIAADKYGYEVMQNSEFEQPGQLLYKPFNSLLINEKPLDYRNFSLFTEGVLSVLDSSPSSNTAKEIPFYVSIRRNGKILEDKKMLFMNKKLDKINLDEIFAFAKYGDLLIIKPVRAEHWRAKRILKLIGGGC
jgi:hypothetical protein